MDFGNLDLALLAILSEKLGVHFYGHQIMGLALMVHSLLVLLGLCLVLRVGSVFWKFAAAYVAAYLFDVLFDATAAYVV